MELTVSAELAGVSGPCPFCGETIQSPAPLMEERKEFVPAEVAPEPARQANVIRRIAPEPRPVRSTPQPEFEPEPEFEHEPVLEEPVGQMMSSSVGERPSKRRKSRGRAIHPITGLSASYDERKESGAIARVALAVLLTVILVAAVFAFMKHQFGA